MGQGSWSRAAAGLMGLTAAALAGCASTAGPAGPVDIGGVISVAPPPGFRVSIVQPGDGVEFRRFRRGQSTGELCTFRTFRVRTADDADGSADRLADRQMESARSSGIQDARRGVEAGADGRPARRFVTASFSLHSTIYTDHSYWVWREAEELVAVTRACQSSLSGEARDGLTRTVTPVFVSATQF